MVSFVPAPYSNILLLDISIPELKDVYISQKQNLSVNLLSFTYIIENL